MTSHGVSPFLHRHIHCGHEAVSAWHIILVQRWAYLLSAYIYDIEFKGTKEPASAELAIYFLWSLQNILQAVGL
jgi:hypothetical protein